MKRLILIAWISFAGIGLLTAQSLGDPSEGVRIEWDTANSRWRVKWWGKAGRTYFIQHSVDLVRAWEWLPVVEAGNDAVKEGGLTVDGGDRSFWRLRYSDIPTSDPRNDDFDGDKVSNYLEVQNQTDPLKFADTDEDSMPDDWEMRYFGGLDQSGADDFDGDDSSNFVEYVGATDPANASTEPPPATATNIVCVENPDGSIDMSWQDNADNEERVVIRVRNMQTGKWDEIGSVPANATRVHINPDHTIGSWE
jgi:hypothetical protein